MGSLRLRWSWLASFGGLALACAAAGCNSSSVIGSVSGGGGTGGSGASTGGGETGGGATRKVDKVDIVLAIDNSASMADKQQILSLALADMITSLTTPPCFDAQGHIVANPSHGACPAGSHAAYAPVTDIHVGVVTSSIGGHGADSCSPKLPDQYNPQQNDAGHLIDRGPFGPVPTYKNLGFLAWDPKQELSPPGDADLTTFTQKIKDIVVGAGESGCGFESQLESWYRFLADPEPSADIVLNSGTQQFEPRGVDDTLLQQRSAFLRPDSLLVIAMLSDEDDCSIKEYGYFPLAGQQTAGGAGSQYRLPRARAVCADAPDDACCGSCAIDPPTGCPVDPTCDINGGALEVADDAINLRCFDQKRRFGIDFAYPADRYVAALSSDKVTARNGSLVDNPIFSYIQGQDTSKPLRDPGLVILTGIVGVPWQDIARDPGNLEQGYKDDVELATMAGGGHTTWDDILGDPTHGVRPSDPFMISSEDPRSGVNPFTGDHILPPNSSSLNAINGHEWNVEHDIGDLQYACTFPLPMPVAQGPDCTLPSELNPICDPANPETQIAAKAYPGQRQLSVLKGLGKQGVVASICPANQVDSTSTAYAYRPAMRAVIERVSGRLAAGN